MSDKRNTCCPDLIKEYCLSHCRPPNRDQVESVDIDIRSLIRRVTGGNDLFYDHLFMM